MLVDGVVPELCIQICPQGVGTGSVSPCTAIDGRRGRAVGESGFISQDAAHGSYGPTSRNRSGALSPLSPLATRHWCAV